jgi:hypothetical protein
MRKYILIAAAVIIVIIIFVFFLRGSDQALVGDEIQMTRLVANGEATSAGFLTVPFSADSDDYDFINVAVDLNNDGAIKSYQADGQTQEEWLVNNMYAKVSAENKNSYSIIIPDKSFDSQTDLPVYIILSEDELSAWSGEKVSGGVFKKTALSKIGKTDYGAYYTPDLTGERAGGFPMDIVVLKEALAADPADEYRNDVPDIDQAHNECVPTSIANSLLWLADKYKFTDKMPNGGDADLIAELKQDLRWNDGGVLYDDVVPGIKTFIKRHKLLLEAHLVAENFDSQILSKISAELKKGQDVEGWLVYRKNLPDGSSIGGGAHMVTIVGVWTSPKGTKFIGINDPLSQGSDATDIYKVDGNKIVQYGFEAGFGTYLRSAFAESPISEEEAVPSVTIDSSNIVLKKVTHASGGDMHTCTVTLSGTAIGPECSFLTLQGGKPGTGSTQDMGGADSCPDWAYWGTSGICVRHLKQKNTTNWSTTFEATTYWGKTELNFSILLGTPKLPLQDLYGGNVCATTETDQKIYDTVTLDCK